MSTQTATNLKLVTKPAFKVVGMKYHGKPGGNDIPQLWNQFGPRMDSVPHTVNAGTSYGICRDMNPVTTEFDYLACVEVDTTADVPAGMEAWEVPAAMYAAFPTTLANMSDTYMQAFEKFLPGAGYHHGSGYDVELYDEAFNPEDPASIAYVYIAVEK